eukprot:4215310-Amphidinium_carterae.2
MTISSASLGPFDATRERKANSAVRLRNTQLQSSPAKIPENNPPNLPTQRYGPTFADYPVRT